MSANYKQQVVDLLKALETGDPKPFSYINPNKYIQHNLDVAEGAAGVAALAKSLPPGTKVNTIRVFQDGEFVFTHTNTISSARRLASTFFALKRVGSSSTGTTSKRPPPSPALAGIE
jgi:predicted SnoaL-like aldol condensation-catalyzing enzyme